MVDESDPRCRLARLWDAEIHRWLQGERQPSAELRPWFNIYNGTGDGAPNLEAFPEPFLGDIFGAPRAVFLALNPGPVYEEFQYTRGTFVNELREQSYTQWAARWRYLDEGKPRVEGGLKFHGKRFRFLQRWVDDSSLGRDAMLAFELYPWHSQKLNAPFRLGSISRSLIRRYIWEPIDASGARYIFGVGAPWLRLLPDLGLQVLGHIATPAKARDRDEVVGFSCERRVVVCKTERGAVALGMQTFGGFPAPPNPDDTRILKEALQHRGWVAG